MLVSPAFAADTAAAATAEGGNFLMSMLPIFLIFLVFYFIVIRPQNKRMMEHRNMIDALKKGDKVVTGGGLIATVRKVVDNSDEIVLELADGVEVKAVRSTIMAVRDKKEAA